MEKEKLYTVKTPNPAFNGWRGHTHFTNGVGKATFKDAQRLVSFWGYSCEELEQPETAEKTKAKGSKKEKPETGSKVAPAVAPELEPTTATQEPAAPEPEAGGKPKAKKK